MAEIKSLSIRGVRSFGPDQCDEQKIAFDKPLTLILGQNGCGKTSIIECLRYAITGQMPPGSRNECFVHDAKVNRSSEVMGQVKLKILNAKENECSITRSMQVTVLSKKTKFQTLESFFSVVDERGVTKDISSRCADLDSLLHEELGVPHAIINSVIFCHQEDSSWPLDEGKKVKERFDAIFDADKYSDCFERLRKIRKEYAVTIKLLEQQVAHLTEKKEDLDKKKLDMVNTETKISESELKMVALTEDLKPITEKLKAINVIQNDLVNFESKREKVKVRIEYNKNQESELLKSIKNVFDGETAELQTNITDYSTKIKAKQKELDESKKSIFTFNKNEEKTANEMSSNEVKYNKLLLLESQHQERIDERKKKIKDVAALAEVEFNEVETNEDVVNGMDAIKSKLETLNDQLKELKSSADAEEKSLQVSVDESRDALARHKQKIVSKESEIKTNRKEITKLEKQISNANESKERLENIQKKFNETEMEYENASLEMDSEECQKDINEDEKAFDKIDEELEDLNIKITRLQKYSAKLKEKDMVDESLKSKEKQLLILKNKHKGSLVELLGEMPTKGFAVTVNRYESKTRKEVDSVKQRLKKKQLEITSLEADRKHVRELLNSRRSELTAVEDQLYRACGTQSYDVTLTKLNNTVEKLQEEQNFLQSSLTTITKYKEQLKENNCCPLCNRGFEAQTEVTDMITDLTTKILNVPAKLEKVSEELQKTSAKKDELLGLKSLNEKVAILKNDDIPELEKKLSDVDNLLSEATEELEGLSMSLIEPEQKLQTAKQILGDMPLIDRYNNEIETTTKDLETIKKICSGLEGDMNLDDATSKQTDLRQKMHTLKTRIKNNQLKLNQHNMRLQILLKKKNDLKEQLLNIQKKVQEVCNLQENLKQLESNREKFMIELKEFQESMGPLEVEVKERQNTKSAAVTKNRNAIDSKRVSINKLESAFDKVKAVDKEIKDHEEKDTQKEMDDIKEANKVLMEKKMKIMADRDELTKKIDALKDELSKQEVYKRDLADNLKLRKVQAECQKCEKELEEINAKVSNVNVDMLSEKEGLITQQTKLFREKAQTEGSLGELKERLKQNKMELMSSRNADVENKFRKKFYELHVTKALDKDIKEYGAALDRCLMQFHKEKMENINLIIREMWRKIYRGNDIDYIEIKTDSSIASESDRKKYDYRVVQSKNGAEIDMRGRCSAGQKVLACLIIRLALAETFSSRFGILALDEPTTNLDQENIKSLCSALGEIVQERMRQKNFMFIIITHDRDFIQSLGNIDKVTHFYEVSRNDEGKSRIKKIRFT